MTRPELTPLMIVADNYRLAQHYARENDLGPEGRAWRYVSRAEQVRGYRGGQWVRVRADIFLSSSDLADRIEAIEVLRMNGFTHVEDLR